MAEDGGERKGAEGSPVLDLEPLRDLENKHVDTETREEPVRHTFVRRKSHELCIITCKGTLGDPAFNKSFRRILSGLNKLLNTGEERVRVRKVEPWNSVRVTFTIPGDAAQRLRALALGGDSVLSRLGILSVQLDPDQVIRVGAGAVQQPQQPQVDPNTLPLPPSSTLPGLGGTAMSCLPGSSLSGLVVTNVLNSGPLPGPSTILGGTSIPGPSRDLSLPGPSGIVTGPSTSVLPSPIVAVAGPSTSGLTSPLIAPGPSTTPLTSPSTPLAGPSGLVGTPTKPILPPPTAQPRAPPPKVFPFHSMNQAANVMRAAEQPPQPITRPVVSGYPPPPYPSKVEGQVVSPLLVNLLQDSSSSSTNSITSTNLAPPPSPAPPVRVKEETSAFSPVAASTNFGSGAFRRLPPPYPGRVKEELPQPTRDIPPTTTAPVIEEKKPQENHQESSSSTTSKRQYLINPLTGVLEPMSSEDEEEEKTEAILDDDLSLDKDSEISTNTTTPLTCTAVLNSAPISTNDSICNLPTSAPPSVLEPSSIPVDVFPQQPKEEKIKLRLKLDKEAVVSVGTVVSSDNLSSNPSPLQETHSSPGYKVEMYVKRSHESSHISPTGGIINNQLQPTVPQINSTLTNNGVEVPRVPPLHISLRGRNAAVVKKDKKRDTKKARKVSGEIKRMKSSKLVVNQPITVMPLSPERSPDRTEVPRSPSPASPRNDPELSGEIVPVRNYPSEAEVASILRSVVPHTTHKLLDESRLKRRESKKKMYPRLEYTGSKKGTKKGSGSLLKSVVKTNSKEVRMMSAVNKAIHRRDSADSTVANSSVFVNSALKQRSNSVPGVSGNTNEEFRPKVNCVFGKTTVPPVVSEPSEGAKQVVVNMCVNTGGSPPSSEAPSITTVPSQKNQTDPAKRNNEGDDSGIESMDALSEKSPNQGESPQRTTGSSAGCKSVSVTCVESPKPDQSQASQLSTKDDQPSDLVSGGGESPVPVRLTPALYTYSNPEKLERRGGAESLSPCSTSGDDEDHLSKSQPSPEVEEDFNSNNSGRRSGNNNKSLLEQLLIDIPSESGNNATTTTTSTTPSTNSETTDSITNSTQIANTRRSRPTRHKTWDSQTWQTNHVDSRQSTLRVSKRKCSESASEGKPEDNLSPVSNEKTKITVTRTSSNPGEDGAEEDTNSVNSGDGSSIRSSVSPAPPAPTPTTTPAPLQSPRLRHSKAEHHETPQLDKNANGSGGPNIRREVSVVLTKISRRTSVRQQKAGSSQSGNTPQKDVTPVVSKETTPVASPAAQRRKTRSQASDSNNEEGGSSAKRRRMSKDMK